MRVKVKILLMVIFLTGFLILCGCSATKTTTETAATISGETTGQAGEAGAVIEEKETPAPETAYVRDILFGTFKGKERVSLLLSELSPFTITRDSESVLLLKMEGMFIPEELRTRYGEGRLDNVDFVFPFQKTEEGEKLACIKIAVKKMVPYRVKKDESGIITIDFDVSSLPSIAAVPAKPAKDREISEQYKDIIKKEMAGLESGEAKQYSGQLMSLELQDASIKSAFRLISEVSGLNIVASPEVQGQKVTMQMKKIPWDQALNTILEINGLGKKQSGSVITVLPLEQLTAAKEEQQKKDIAEGKLRQVSIEARIVEASMDFRRQLGVLWGGGVEAGLGSTNFGMMMGSAATGTMTPLPGGIGLTNSSTAVNFPSAAATPAIGMLLGSGSAILSAQLSALEASGSGKIISSPRVTALEGEAASIEQGKRVPFPLTDADGQRVIQLEDVVLRLDVTPNITTDGSISMEINAKNEELDWANAVDGRPATSKSEVKSTIVVKNGDTIVIGGVYKTTESKAKTGVPYLSEIPVLGWLFKYETTIKVRRELLIFVTPRIME